MAMKLKIEKAKGLFVTGTDTGVGKTLVTGVVGRLLGEMGYRVGVFKPIATGCEGRREGLVSLDAEFLAHCTNSECSLEQINPVRYREPLAPLVAAERVGVPIDWEAMKLGYRNVTQKSDLVLVEGVGGVMVPLERDYLVLDLMVDMGLPVLIVARSGLGTINHTLMTVEVCRARGLNLVGIVMNGYQPDGATVAEETNPQVLAEASGLKVLAVLPQESDSSVEEGLLGEAVVAAARLTRWEDCLEEK